MDTLYRQWLILRMLPRKTRIATTYILNRLDFEHGIRTTLHTLQRDLNALALPEKGREFQALPTSSAPCEILWCLSRKKLLL